MCVRERERESGYGLSGACIQPSGEGKGMGERGGVRKGVTSFDLVCGAGFGVEGLGFRVWG